MNKVPEMRSFLDDMVYLLFYFFRDICTFFYEEVIRYDESDIVGNDWLRCYASLDGASSVSGSILKQRSASEPADPTAKYAEAKLYFRERLDMVTRIATEAAGDLDNYMILAVTQGQPYSKLMPPCCKEVWYTMYRRFFWLLDKARK